MFRFYGKTTGLIIDPNQISREAWDANAESRLPKWIRDERAFPLEHPQVATLGWGGKFSEIPPALIAQLRLK